MTSSSMSAGGATIQSVIGGSSPSLVSPSRFNEQLSGSQYVKPSNYNVVVQNVSNEGGVIYELNNDLSVRTITPSPSSTRLLLNGDWTDRADVIDYMVRKNKTGNLFFARFD